MSESAKDLEVFRQEIRTWFEDNYPKSLIEDGDKLDAVWGARNIDFPREDTKQWLDLCVEKGYCTPGWPKEYGGAGFNDKELAIYKEEMGKFNARAPQVNLGIFMIGPVILEYGTEEQKLDHVTKISRGEIRWCQGYSEPGAGSDLASLQTRAEDKGDHFLVNGSKIWTSYADKSDYCYCLVRTDPDAPKREGITFLLIDMASEGISTKPIELITGERHFCQTFFDNVKVPKNAVLGEINKGWTVGKRVLDFERNMMSEIGGGGVGGKSKEIEEEDRPLTPRRAALKYLGTDAEGKVSDRLLRDQIARQETYQRAFGMTQKRMMDEFMSGAGDMNIATIFKFCATEDAIRKYELMLKIIGEQSLGWADDEHFNTQEKEVTMQWMDAKTHAIAGGTSEIQLNIIAKQVLGLPGVAS